MGTRLKKNAKGYGYTYTDLAEIHKYLEEEGWTYYQYVEPDPNGNDYIMTVKVDKDGKESMPIRGCKIPQATLSGKNNPAQEYGSALTYARRYSLLMAFGLATTDDDAESLTVSTADSNRSTVKKQGAFFGEDKSMLTDKAPERTLAQARHELTLFCNEHKLVLADIWEQYGIDKDTPLDIFDAKFAKIRSDYVN